MKTAIGEQQRFAPDRVVGRKIRLADQAVASDHRFGDQLGSGAAIKAIRALF